MTTDTTINEDIVRADVDAINRHDVAAMRALWADDVTVRFPDATCHGADAIAAYIEGILAALPDFHIDLQTLAADGDSVFIRYVITGTHTGPFKGVSGTGKRVELPGMDHFTIRDGKIVSNFVIFDQMDIGRQLGLLPPENSAPDKALKALFNGGIAAKKKIGQVRSKA
ncbi:MAG: ester cyclase [Sporichthyaceae bacterium]